MIPPVFDEFGLIEKIANNKTNREFMNLNSIESIIQKLDFYRGYFGKIHDLPLDEFEKLKQNISTFFNLKPMASAAELPGFLVRISNNNRILAGKGKELNYLTDIDELLAPPVKYCTFGRCNIPEQQVAYCALDEASAYWETKPQNGDVITISRFQLKPGAKAVCTVIRTEKTENPEISHDLQKVFYLLEEFFIEIFSLPVDRLRPRDYLFSALISSDQLYYPVPSDGNIEAIIFPSVQRKKMGDNIAIKNDLLLKKYDLYSVETKFILDEYEDLDPSIAEPTTDSIIGSFGTTAFDSKTGKILYNKEKADELFNLFRMMQTSPNKQVRIDNGPDIPKSLSFNLAPIGWKPEPKPAFKAVIKSSKLSRNDKVNVEYANGVKFLGLKFKKVEQDLNRGLCKIVD
ncbi:RES domain-containing protein [Mucilaginibacter gossypii]|uniref:RES domain-containing protein n=1 Tax=Mucilaginibacter gossypii TaxID=551996 RepID=A0A1G8B8X1_9SPHI|nr:RES domain-containing protein [Mucilaginibacter gossypii]SDH29551.1 RES domain-containing protein [Mucilaginibacter gossypii]